MPNSPKSALYDEWHKEQQAHSNASTSRHGNENRLFKYNDSDQDEDDQDEDENENDKDEKKMDPVLPPIFTLMEHALKVSKKKGFTLNVMCICNDTIYLGSLEGTLLYGNTTSIVSLNEIPIEKKTRIVFLSTFKEHVFCTCDNGNNFVFNTSSKKIKKLDTLSGHRISCIGFDYKNTSNVSQHLLGTDTGLLLSIDLHTLKCTKIFSIANQGPIAALVLSTVVPGSSYYMMMTTSGTNRQPTRIYQFLGGPTLEAMMQMYTNVERLRFQEVPGNVRISKIQVLMARTKMKSFAVLTGEGVLCGDLTLGIASSLENIISGTDLVPFLTSSSRKGVISQPLDMTLSEFHIILLYPKKVVVLNKLSKSIVLESNFDSRVGTVIGLSRDDSTGRIYIYSDRRLQEIIIQSEDRNVWKLYLTKACKGDPREFDTALSMCKTDHQRQVVWTAQADHFFTAGYFERAALLYAKTSRSFEEVALRFMKVSKEALLLFLLQKLKRCHRSEKTQRTMLTTWLVELYLDRFNHVKREDDNKRGQLLLEFKQFLKENKKALNPATTFTLIASHGRSQELVFYAHLIEDYEKVVDYHMQRGDYSQAIDILRGAPVIKVEELFYKYSPELMEACPKETVQAWKAAKELQASRLIPAIVRGTQGNFATDSDFNLRIDLAIEYLSFAVKNGNRDSTIHNYLLYLYAKHPDERQLIKFLRRKHDGIHLFDITYALRLCTQHEKTRACIYIYSAMGLYLEAVEKALQVDVKVAKEIACQPDDKETKKKLWTLIAKHNLDAGGDVKEAMGILKESSGLLLIEDLLPYLPDFTVINDFKREICDSLENYTSRIDGLKEEMKEYTDTADLIRSDMHRLRQRVTLISGSQRCDLTGENILEKEFYVFPCGHAFHAVSLRTEMQNHLHSFQRQTVKELVLKLNELTDTTTEPGIVTERETVQSKLDRIVAPECLYCGEVMIKTITAPFVMPEEAAGEGADWSI